MIGNLKLGNVWVFCSAVSYANEHQKSAVQKSKHQNQIKLITLAFGSESYLQTNLPVLGLPWQRVPLTPPDGQRRPLSQPQVDVGELLDRGAASREITDFVPTNLDGSTRNGCQSKS